MSTIEIDDRSWYQPTTIGTNNDGITNSSEQNQQPNNFDTKKAYHSNNLDDRPCSTRPQSARSRVKRNSSIYDFGQSMTARPSMLSQNTSIGARYSNRERFLTDVELSHMRE